MSLFTYGENENLYWKEDNGNCFCDGKPITKAHFDIAERLYFQDDLVYA